MGLYPEIFQAPLTTSDEIFAMEMGMGLWKGIA
jgi:hypothetical protein